MLYFRDWLLNEEKKIPAGAIKVKLPGVRQQTKYSCGPAIFRAVAEFLGMNLELSDKEWAKIMGATPEDGLSDKKILRWAKKLNIHASKQNMSDEVLRSYLDKGIPVICAVQAWGSKKYYKKGESGHWVAAIGYTNKYVIFEDPALDADPRGFISWDELDSRWHDQCEDGPCRRLGIALWKHKVEPDRKGRVMTRIE